MEQNFVPTVRWVLFGFHGRIARQSYILGQLFMISLFGIIVARLIAAGEDESALALWGLVMIGLLLVSAFSMIAMTVKRLHDLGMPGILAICLFVPTINFLMVVALMILPSRQETNEHGPPPFPEGPGRPRMGGD